MARKHGQHRGLEPYRCADGKIRWRIRVVVDGKLRRFKGLWNTVREAERMRDKIRHQLHEGTLDLDREAIRRTVAEEIDFYLTTIIAKLNQRRERQFGAWWKTFFGGQRLRAVTPVHIEQARVRLLSKGITPATVNRYTDWLRHVLNVALKQGRLAKNPILAIERYQEFPKPIYQYSLEEEGRLAEALGPYASWMRLAILTNLRQADQFRLRKTWIDWTEHLIQIPLTKSKKPQVVLLSLEAEAILKAWCDLFPKSPWVLPGVRKKRHPMSARYFYTKIFKPACQRAGIPAHPKLWHACRHTFGSRAARRRFSTDFIREAGGWLTEGAAKRYIAAYREDLREVMEAVSAEKPIVRKLPPSSTDSA